jgi:hypothetical protein
MNIHGNGLDHAASLGAAPTPAAGPVPRRRPMRGEKSHSPRVQSFVMLTSKRLLSAFVVMANVGCAATTSASRAVEPTAASAPRAAPATVVALAQSPQPVAEAPALPPSDRDRMLRAEQEAAA